MEEEKKRRIIGAETGAEKMKCGKGGGEKSDKEKKRRRKEREREEWLKINHMHEALKINP